MAVDVVMIVFCLHAAFWLRLDEWGSLDTLQEFVVVGLVAIATVAVFIKLGLYRAVLRYLGFQVLIIVALGAASSAVFTALSAYYFHIVIPRSVPIIYALLLALSVAGTRLVFRGLVAQAQFKRIDSVLIYGAGSAGRQLAQALRSSSQYQAVAFIDEDLTLVGSSLMGLRVYSMTSVVELIQRKHISRVLLAVPAASHQRRKQILEALAPLPVEVRTVPELSDIVSGNAKIDDIKEVDIDDLLGRDPVIPQPALMEANIRDKVVMVTGAGGSIGSELCRQIVRQKPKALVLFELSEFGLYQIDRELSNIAKEELLEIEVIPLLGSVQRINRLATTMKSFSVDTVYHAAAYKHVPLVEYNVVEGVRNNVFGTYYTAKAAIEAGVESFVLISTDKAVRPTNVMGTTKRVAELGLQALAERENAKTKGTRFCMVRFGNVLGSSGSVIPLFKKQIAGGGPVTVTHPDIIRYFMTIPEAAQLVIQAGAMGKGGDVFVLDMGDPVKITDLAENLIQLSGLEVRNDENPYGDIAIEFSGLRPGEKLFEELLIGDSVGETAHPRIMTANERFLPLEEYLELIERLDNACHNFEHDKIRELLCEAPADFNPTDGIGDLVWLRLNEKLSLKEQGSE